MTPFLHTRRVPPTRDRRRADRVRAAICITLLDADTPLSISELVAALRRWGLPLGEHANKTVADAIRWELQRHHVRKVGRGRFAIDRLSKTTAFYMRHRVNAYVADPSQSYSRPDNYPRIPAAPD